MRLHFHGNPHDRGATLRSYTLDQSQLTLGRVAPRIVDLDVFLEDVNGPRGGEDKGCRLVARLFPRGEVVVQGSGGDWESLIHATLRRLARAIIRELDRRRTSRARRIAR